MEPVSLTLGIRGLIAVILALGGVTAMVFGFVLFRNGHGTNRSTAAFKIGKFLSASANSVGAVLMITAVGWGWLSVEALPKLKTTNGEVYALATEKGSVSAPAFDWSALEPDPAKIDEKQAVAAFKDVLSRSANAPHTGATVLGNFAAFDPAAASATKDAKGRLTFTVPLRTADASTWAGVVYGLEKRDGKLVLVPKSATFMDAPLQKQKTLEYAMGPDNRPPTG